MNNKKKFRIEVADIWGPILTFISIIFTLVTSWFKKTDLTGAIIAVSYAAMATGCIAGGITLCLQVQIQTLI